MTKTVNFNRQNIISVVEPFIAAKEQINKIEVYSKTNFLLFSIDRNFTNLYNENKSVNVNVVYGVVDLFDKNSLQVESSESLALLFDRSQNKIQRTKIKWFKINNDKKYLFENYFTSKEFFSDESNPYIEHEAETTEQTKILEEEDISKKIDLSKIILPINKIDFLNTEDELMASMTLKNNKPRKIKFTNRIEIKK
jgi:hypothetical protein